MSKKRGLLVMHYGTPATLDDVLPYYTHIRRGRPPEPAQLNDLVERYKSIGGPSPLAHISERQAELVLSGVREEGIEANLYVGAKHTHPFVGEVVERMAADGIEEAVGVVLAPHFSTYSVASYEHYAFEARDKTAPAMKLNCVQRWGTLPELVAGLSERVQHQLAGWTPDETLVVFSAHSLPQRIVADGDPYQDELLETSQLVADRLQLPNWTFAFQSASTTGEPWLGPDILDVLADKAGKGFRNVVSCTVGFVSDHLEVLYDLGIEARDKCAELGLNFRRAETIGEDPKVMGALGRLAAGLFA